MRAIKPSFREVINFYATSATDDNLVHRCIAFVCLFVNILILWHCNAIIHFFPWKDGGHFKISNLLKIFLEQN